MIVALHLAGLQFLHFIAESSQATFRAKKKMPAKAPASWLSRQVSNRTERKEIARWAILAKGTDCRAGLLIR
jgi:hypothetical protein